MKCRSGSRKSFVGLADNDRSRTPAAGIATALVVRRVLAGAVFCLVAAGCGTKEIDGLGPDSPVGGRGGSAGFPDGGPFLACGPDGTGAFGPASGMNFTESTPAFPELVAAVEPPPPISGGTMVVLRDGVTVVAADADRDRVFVVDLSTGGLGGGTVRAAISLTPRDQPGRAVEDAAGKVHLALRGGGALITIDPVAGKVTMRRSACPLPRGLAYDAANDRLLLACAGGELLTFAPTGAVPERKLNLQTDLRDVVIDGPRVLVTRFRSAQTMVLDGQGKLIELIQPAAFRHGAVAAESHFTPSVAWRTVAMPDGGAMMVHQRGMSSKVRQTAGGYGGLSPCDAIVHTSVTRMRSGERPSPGAAMPGFVLPVDIAVSPDGKQMAMVAAGNGHAQSGARKVFVSDVAAVTEEWSQGCGNDDKHGPAPWNSCDMGGFGAGARGGAVDGEICPPGFFLCASTKTCVHPAMNICPEGAGGSPGNSSAGPALPAADGGITGAGGAGGSLGGGNCYTDIPTGVEPVSVGFAGPDRVVVQTREPAQLWVLTKADPLPRQISLSTESRTDTGHAVFHSNSGGGLACASCHPEGHEDGRVWNFECDGSRRTQDLAGGLKGTEPFHWNGDLRDFPKLMETVFSGRMSGPPLAPPQMTAALNWIDKIPAKPPLRLATDVQVQRGKAIFHSAAAGCATCHLGPALTNNVTVDVGTSRAFQVPSLRGLAWRAPYMHDGCSPTLAGRFGNEACDGGDAHGKTSHLTPPELADLVAFLESL